MLWIQSNLKNPEQYQKCEATLEIQKNSRNPEQAQEIQRKLWKSRASSRNPQQLWQSRATLEIQSNSGNREQAPEIQSKLKKFRGSSGNPEQAPEIHSNFGNPEQLWKFRATPETESKLQKSKASSGSSERIGNTAACQITSVTQPTRRWRRRPAPGSGRRRLRSVPQQACSSIINLVCPFLVKSTTCQEVDNICHWPTGKEYNWEDFVK